MSKRGRDVSWTDASDPPTKRAKVSNDDDDAEQHLLNLLDDVEAEAISELDATELRALMTSLKTAIIDNQKQRSKFGEEPLKFKDSEVALNDVIQQLAMKLPESPSLFAEFVQLNGVDCVSRLLQHENIDIVNIVIALVKEMTESDNFLECERAIIFVLEFVKQNGVYLLLQNLSRLHDPNAVAKPGDKEDDEPEDDSETIFAVLSILENLSEVDIHLCVVGVRQCSLFRTLLAMMRKKQQFATHIDEIQLYLSELLCIYLQPMPVPDDDDDADAEKEDGMDGQIVYQQFADIRGCEKICDLLHSQYMDRDPSLSEEKEYVCNLMDALSLALASTVNQNAFFSSKAGGLHTLLQLTKQKNFLKQGCLHALCFAVTNHAELCVQLVDLGGLKTLFAEFMNDNNIKRKYRKHQERDQMEEYLCCTLVHLFCHLSDVHLLRLRAKFQEKDGAKIDRLIELHAKYWTRLEDNDLKELQLRQENNVDAETFAERYARRLDNGLYTLQLVDLLIAFIFTFEGSESAVMKERVIHSLHQCDMDIEQVKTVLNEYDNVTNDDEDEDDNQNKNRNQTDSDADANLGLGAIAGKLVKLM